MLENLENFPGELLEKGNAICIHAVLLAIVTNTNIKKAKIFSRKQIN